MSRVKGTKTPRQQVLHLNRQLIKITTAVRKGWDKSTMAPDEFGIWRKLPSARMPGGHRADWKELHALALQAEVYAAQLREHARSEYDAFFGEDEPYVGIEH